MRQRLGLLVLCCGLGLWQGGLAAPPPEKGLPEPVINVRDVGARGDGTGDDYAALQAAAQRLNAAHGGTLYFPPGTYRINRYRITSGSQKNDVGNIAFVGCRKLRIIGYHAKLDVKGDFRRTADRPAGAYQQSDRESVIPLAFVDCHSFSVKGLEIDGNVDRMTRDRGVAEGFSHGLFTRECSDYVIQDVYIHHFASDGLYLGGSDTKTDTNARLVNVRSAYNGRQGMTILQLRGGTFQGCRFENTGHTGAYGEHAPGAGVDVEPDAAPPAVDVKTGNLLFVGCTFRNNAGPAFQCGQGAKSENVTLRRCTVDRGSSAYPHTIILAVPGGLIEDSTLSVNGIAPTWGGSPGAQTTLRRCHIVSPWKNAIRVAGDGDVIVEGNTIREGSARPPEEYAAGRRDPRFRFRDNTIVPAAGSARSR